MDEVLCQKRLACAGLAQQQHRRGPPCHHGQSTTLRAHRGIAAPQHLRLLEFQRGFLQRVVHADAQRIQVVPVGQIGHGLRGQRPVRVDQRQVVQSGEQHHGEPWMTLADATQDGSALKAPGASRAHPLSQGQQPVLGHIEVHVQQYQVDALGVALQVLQRRRTVRKTRRGLSSRMDQLEFGHVLGNQGSVGVTVVDHQHPRSRNVAHVSPCRKSAISRWIAVVTSAKSRSTSARTIRRPPPSRAASQASIRSTASHNTTHPLCGVSSSPTSSRKALHKSRAVRTPPGPRRVSQSALRTASCKSGSLASEASPAKGSRRYLP